MLSTESESESLESDVKDIEEVANYVKAMNQGLARLGTLPISTRLLKEMHKTFMRGVRGAAKTPGEFRRSQNWIGRPGGNLYTAEFVPPPPEEVDGLMSDLERFIHRQDRMPPLLKAALIHAQFETIHPFLDGNSRLGRLLITYLLVYWKMLEKPLLYISYFLKANRTEYYARLMSIRLQGDWESWVRFFFRAVYESAEMAYQSATEICQLIATDRARIRDSGFSPQAARAYDLFCRQPILNNAALAKALDISKPTAQRVLDDLVHLGLLKEISGQKRGRRYSYRAYLDILKRDTTSRVE